ncbi:hypothetical protein [Pseudoduganella albidiflava]|uniref:Tetratricopeptide repeat protein n=1 Tax=Pseudoduganella albidiflava TaxID=321983 RepID=A0A411X1Y1_9BURK|nr:hypothetical protein [Pseudoduganella albidiflava]QBI02969.1 hypothetical protein EYF70_20550 [Pseudoduganella albidiflava]GGY57828.1 hypothetical protein GCM10007387_45370 [Pseudoduganella albidiflava]
MEPVRQAIMARQAGDYDGALRVLAGIADDLRRDDPTLPPLPFIVLFEWGQLIEVHSPARDALAALRDEHVRRLLDGDTDSAEEAFGGRTHSRFWDIAWFNDTLGDSRSTYEVFLHLLRTTPEVAARYSSRALPAIVEQGDYALGERYLPEPLSQLGELNATARWAPLLPADFRPPHLSALLSGYVQALRLRGAILHGLGRHAEAGALRMAGLAGIESEELRALAEKELVAPGAISQLVATHQASLPPSPA